MNDEHADRPLPYKPIPWDIMLMPYHILRPEGECIAIVTSQYLAAHVVASQRPMLDAQYAIWGQGDVGPTYLTPREALKVARP